MDSKNSSDCQIGLGLRPRPIWQSSEFFSSNYFQIGQHVVLLHIQIQQSKMNHFLKILKIVLAHFGFSELIQIKKIMFQKIQKIIFQKILKNKKILKSLIQKKNLKNLKIQILKILTGTHLKFFTDFL